MRERHSKGERIRLLAKVHVAKKQMALEDADYRAILLRVTGHTSSAQVEAGALVALLQEFERLGFRAPRPRSAKPHVRKIYALWSALKPHLSDPSERALRAFVRRQTGVASPDWLDGAQANKVTEGLKAWLARAKASAQAAARTAEHGEQEAAPC